MKLYQTVLNGIEIEIEVKDIGATAGAVLIEVNGHRVATVTISDREVSDRQTVVVWDADGTPGTVVDVSKVDA